MKKHEHEVDAVGTTQMEYNEEAGPSLTDAGGFGPGIRPGDQVVISGLSSDEPIRNRHARAVTVIETKMLERGRGTNRNPDRFVVEYWTLDGRQLAEADKYAGDTIDRLEGENFRLRRDLDMQSRRRDAEQRRGDELRDKCTKLEVEITKLKEAKRRAAKRARAKTATKKKTTPKKKGRR